MFEVPPWLINIYQWIVYLTPVWALILAVFWKPIQKVFDREKSRLTAIESKLQSVQDDIEDRKKVSHALLHHEIFQTARDSIKQGFITEVELENLEILYHEYKKLNGNGTAERLYKECCNLPLKDFKNFGVEDEDKLEA